MISIIILTNNKPELIVQCLNCIIEKSHDSKNVQIIIGDTGVSNWLAYTLNDLLSFFHKSSLTKKFNYHFSKNNNSLSKEAIFDNLLFLNNDVFIQTKNFDLEINKYLKHKNIGSLGAKLIFPNKNTIQHFGVEIFDEGINYGLGYHPLANTNHLISKNIVGLKNSSHSPKCVTGAFLAIRKELFIKVNGFDEDYNEECQDVDLGLNLRSLDYKNIIPNSLVAYHLENGTRKLNDSCHSDRALLKKKWSRWNEIWNKDSKNHVNKNIKKVLFIRKEARGDLLASLTLALQLKKNNYFFLTIMTDYVDIASSFSFVDYVIPYQQDYSSSNFDIILYPKYESKIFMNTVSWYDSMALSLGIPPAKNWDKFYAEAAENILDNSRPFLLNFIKYLKKDYKYIVVSNEAGWKERTMPNNEFVETLKILKNKYNPKIIYLGTEPEKSILNEVDFCFTNLNFSELFNILKESQFNLLPDSYLFHVSLLANKNSTYVFTCKTSMIHVFGESFNEIRINNLNDDLICVSEGCRIKDRDGAYYVCEKNFMNISKKIGDYEFNYK